MPQKRILYLIGSGASKAVCPSRIPTMEDFMQTALDNLAGPGDEACILAFEALRAIGAFAGGSLPAGASRFPLDEIKDPEAVKRYQSTFGAAIRHFYVRGDKAGINLEALFQFSVAKWSNDGGDAYIRLTYLISWLFSKLERNMPQQAWTESPYLHLAKAVTDRNGPGHVHNFISFNYDVWLERELFKVNSGSSRLWNPIKGYLDELIFKGYLGPTQRATSAALRPSIYAPGARAEEAIRPSQVPNSSENVLSRVLKPHGSLSWISPNGTAHGPPLLLLDGDVPTGNVATLDGGLEMVQIQTTSMAHPEVFFPLIVPPSPAKVRSGELFWKIQKEMDRQLESAHVIVIIGWHMPDTDAEMRNRIERVVVSRGNQIETLIVCNLGQPDPFYRRFEALLWPKNEPIYWDRGFSREFVESQLLPRYDQWLR